MSKPKSMIKNQYATNSNLDIRITLHQRFSTNKYGWHRWIFDQLLDLPEDAVILELGCGTGKLWTDNLDRIPTNWEVTLTDMSSGMIEKTQASLPNAKQFHYEVMDAQSISHPDQNFDAVIANHMLYHIPDFAQALTEIKRILKPGGRLFASTMSVTNMQELRNLAREFDPQIDYPDNKSAAIFGLENGADKLTPFFEQIELRRYIDSLQVDEAKPLVDYLLSFQGMSNITEIIVGDKVTEFEKMLAQKIQREGSIRITKDAGIFIAEK